MNNTISLNKGSEKLPNNRGYLYTSINYNRLTNAVEGLPTYFHSKTLFEDSAKWKCLRDYTELQSYLDEIYKDSLLELVDDEQA